MITWAIIPVKPLMESKSRLATILPADRRAALTAGILTRTLSILDNVPEISRTLVVSRDPLVLKIARQHKASTYVETDRQNLNVALTRSAHIAAARYADCILVLPADLPLIEAGDIELILDAVKPARPVPNGNGRRAVPERSMAICSDHNQDGTNALVLCPPTGFEFHFGPGSFESHLLEAERLGMSRRIVHAPGIKFDLDTEDDWRMLQVLRPEIIGANLAAP